MLKKLESLTEKLIECNREFNEIFEKTREKKADGDFFKEVKPFADGVKKTTDEWKAEAFRQAEFLKEAGIGQKQIESACEHIEKLSIQAFFVKTSRYTFVNSSRTVEYTLNALMGRLRGRQTGEPAGKAGNDLR